MAGDAGGWGECNRGRPFRDGRRGSTSRLDRIAGFQTVEPGMAVGFRPGQIPAGVEREPEGLAEGGQRPLGGVGLGRLEGAVMNLARRATMSLAGAVAVADDGAAGRAHGDPHPGGVDRGKAAARLAAEQALGLDGLAVPAVEAEDAVGLGQHIPALDIGEFLAVPDPGFDVAGRDAAGERPHLAVGEAHHRTLTLSTGSALESVTPGTASPFLRSLISPMRSRRGSRASQ